MCRLDFSPESCIDPAEVSRKMTSQREAMSSGAAFESIRGRGSSRAQDDKSMQDVDSIILL